MKKKTKMINVCILVSLVALYGCATVAPVAPVAPVVYDVISSGEVLPSLTKITDVANSVNPIGGDNDGPLFFAVDATKTGHYDIYKKEKPLSGATSQMTSLGTTGFAQFPTYSKAKDKIAFCMGYDIYTMPATKGKALTQVTSANNLRDNHPCFSPDGNLIIYDRNKQTLASDGKYYYYSRTSEIWVKNLQTGENILLGNGINPRFSPDGKKIVYAKYESNKSQIWIMDADGENQSRLTDNNSLVWAYQPSFSPDGKFIVFAGDNGDNDDIYIVPVAGGDITRLTISKATDCQPYWSTDGYIYFTSDRGGVKGDYNIWRFKYSVGN